MLVYDRYFFCNLTHIMEMGHWDMRDPKKIEFEAMRFILNFRFLQTTILNSNLDY